MTLRPEDFEIATLGPASLPSPLRLSGRKHDGLGNFVPIANRVPYDIEIVDGRHRRSELSFEKAGPRERIYFNPKHVTAAIVTCGGLCPGLNNVIRSVFLELRRNYGVRRVLGIRHGFLGLNPDEGPPPIQLNDDLVEEIHKLGGTILGTSRGPQDPQVMVDFLQQEKIDMLFCVGGDGTLRGAHALGEEIRRRKLSIAVVGIPKTIDNDIQFVYRTFGYFTAIEKAQEVLRGAHIEARAAVRGIGLVKLMGRDAGFIAAGATLASQEVNYCLVPEVHFPLDGENGLLASLERRLQTRHHALIALAEGAGQHLMTHERQEFDASGNRKHADVGPFLKDQIEAHFARIGRPVNLKYIDPSYYIRSVPANTPDRLLSDSMARNAVHTAMAGNTDVLIGLWHGVYVNVPILTAIREKKCLHSDSGLWMNVLLSTGQPRWEMSEPAPDNA